MPAINRGQQTTDVGAVDLKQMVGPDPHRPGPARARLLAEHIPVWAIVGHVEAVARKMDSVAVTDDVIARVAADFDIRREAVQAALLYYQAHRGAIDAVLQANAAAIS